MLFNILIVIFAVVLFLGAFMLVRALLFGQRSSSGEAAELTDVDAGLVAEHLAEVIRCKTISLDGGVFPHPEAFDELHAILEKNYPRVHQSLKRELINGRSLLYTWQGSDPQAEGVLFMAHQDVVPVDPNTEGEWKHAPFSGEIVDGYVWGRGTLDIKSQIISIMEAVEGLLAKGFVPARTVYLSFGHDEEIGGVEGDKALSDLLVERGIRLAAVLDEGGMVVDGALPGVNCPVALVGVAEKGYLSLKLTVEAAPGHSSMPNAQTAIGILSTALAKIEKNQMPQHTGSVEALYRALGSNVSFGNQFVFANLWLLGGVVKKKLAASRTTNAMSRTTTAITMIAGGVKENILPGKAEAVINFRIYPGDSIASVCEHVRSVVDDDRVRLEPLEHAHWEPSPVSPSDDEIFASMSTAIQQVYPQAAVTPYLVMGATDSRYFVKCTERVYRFSPFLLDQSDLGLVHGTNECLAVESLGKAVQFFDRVIQTWAAGKES